LNVSDAARFYIERGWQVVPLAPRSKACVDDQWLKIVFSPEDFRPGDNIGIRSVNSLVVVDEDSPEVVALADAFLPPTGAVYGRPSKPRSKRLYACRGLDKTIAYRDEAANGDKHTLVEIRCAHQDMAPPSIHPDGEALSWDGTVGEAAQVEADRLRRAVRLLATAAMVTRYYASPGARHEWALALAGTLRLLGISEDEGAAVVEQAGKYASDAKVADRAVEVRTTYARSDDDGVTGPKKLTEVMGERGHAFVATLRKIWGVDGTGLPAAKLQELNARFFVIDVGSDTVVGEEIPCSNDRDTRRWTEFKFRSFEDFRRKLVKERPVVVGMNARQQPMTKKLPEVWLESPHGTQYERLVYAPPGSGLTIGPRDLNGWKGFTVVPAPGDWHLTRDELLLRVVCRGDQALFAWLMDWTAALFQLPGRHAETALVFTGKQGTGKNVVADTVLGWSFDGRHARVTTHTRQVLGDFNSILSGLCLLVLDEVGLKTEGEANATKGLVTGHTVDINRKGIDVDRERSMLHVIFLSNDVRQALRVAPDDRRYAFFEFGNEHQNDHEFFKAVEHELDECGGRAAMLHDLLRREVNWDRLRLAPDTEAKQTAKRGSWTNAQWFIYRQMRSIGEGQWANTKDGERRLRKTEESASYALYLDSVKVSLKDPQSDLHRTFKDLAPDGHDVNKPVKASGVTTRDFWTLPRWNLFRQSFERAVGCSLPELDEFCGEPPSTIDGLRGYREVTEV
jgi:hypothetical protein